MTDKQEMILNAALELFANQGYNATSTNRIAKQAGVSEGLIFRHFGSKEGLLNAIVSEAETKVKQIFAEVVFEADAQEVIRKILQFPRFIANHPEEADFWKLQYKIKWEIEAYHDKKMETVEKTLASAFRNLQYQDPDTEAKLLLVILDGLATRFFLQENFEIEKMLAFLEKKYLG